MGRRFDSGGDGPTLWLKLRFTKRSSCCFSFLSVDIKDAENGKLLSFRGVIELAIASSAAASKVGADDAAGKGKYE